MQSRRQPNSPRILEIAVLRPEDLAFLQEKRVVPMLKKIRDSHHAIARYLASGMSMTETAQVCGFSITRISLLAQDPGVKELIEHYRQIITDEWVKNQDEYHRLIYANGIKAQRQIGDQLDKADEEDEPVPLRLLTAIASDSADRVGYGKKSTTVNVNVDFAGRLEAARRRASSQIDAKADSAPSLLKESA